MSVGIYIEKTFICKWSLATNYHYFNVFTFKESSIPMKFNCGRNPDLF